MKKFSALLAVFLASAAVLFTTLALCQKDSPVGKSDSNAVDQQKIRLRQGEKLLYSIEWEFINAGYSFIRVDSELTYSRDRQAYHLVNETWSNPFFSNFYRVHDRSESFVDFETLQSLVFHKKLEEGSYRHEEDVEFDHRLNKAYYSTGDTVELIPGAKDILLSLFYTRMLPITEGNVVRMDNHTDKHNYPLEVRVVRREQLKTIFGTTDCLVVEPLMRSPGLFENKGRLLIWLTDDQRKIPVLMKSKVVVGSFKAVLKEYNAGMD